MLRRTLKSNAGFSLVELMVVVAIIGVLASIAVPNVNKYIAKSRRSEAKTNLSGIFSSEQTFNTEYNTFTNAFEPMGFRPTGVLKYSVGFTGGGALDPAATLQNFGYPATGAAPANFTTGNSTAGAYCGKLVMSAAGCQMAVESVAEAGAFARASATTAVIAFTAAAASNIYQPAVADTLSIDQNKSLLQVADGIQ